MFDVHQLQVFLAVAEKLSFTGAAGGLFLPQPAVSQQMARLEASVGCALLPRRGRAVSLTPAGREMAHQARRVLAAVDEAGGAGPRASHPDPGRLRIWPSPTPRPYLIPLGVPGVRECFPGYSLSITPGDSPAMVEHLLAETVDLALMIRPERQRKLACHDLFEDELQFLVSPLHPWAKAGRVDRRQLADQPMVLYGRG